MGEPTILSRAWETATELPELVAGTSVRMLFSPGSAYSLFALALALTVAAGFTLRRRRQRTARLRAALRAVLRGAYGAANPAGPT